MMCPPLPWGGEVAAALMLKGLRRCRICRICAVYAVSVPYLCRTCAVSVPYLSRRCRMCDPSQKHRKYHIRIDAPNGWVGGGGVGGLQTAPRDRLNGRRSRTASGSGPQ